ncbi:MAG TPA: DUF5049 domain-containing protein [Rubrobacteraceae bacterium]|nr:DUF5049 domain-containing protein [Rubrobacteraceae bacterium]
MNEPVRIPTDVLEGLRFVQASGGANMFDLPHVAQLALRAGYTQTADWLLGEENREAYVRGVLDEFPSEGEQERVTEPIKIPEEVYHGLEYVRESGETNMFDIWRVASLALQFGYPETTEWLGEKENHANYMLGVLRGFRPLQGEYDA